MLFSGTVEADGNGSHGVMGTETWRMDQVGPGQIRVLQHQSELEPLETTAEHTPSFPNPDFWGRTHFEHTPSDGNPRSTW